MAETHIDVTCEHCGKVARVDPNGCQDLNIEFIGAKHRFQFIPPTGRSTQPIVIDDGGMTDVEETATN